MSVAAFARNGYRTIDTRIDISAVADFAARGNGTLSNVAAVIRALWHTFRLDHSVQRDRMVYPGVRTHVYFCSCGDSWGAPPGYRDGEYRSPHGF